MFGPQQGMVPFQGGQMMSGGFGQPMMGYGAMGGMSGNPMSVNNNMMALGQQQMQMNAMMGQMMNLIGTFMNMMMLKQMQTLMSAMASFGGGGGGGGGGTPGVGNFLGSGSGGGGGTSAAGAASGVSSEVGSAAGWGAELAKYAGSHADGPGGYCYKWVGQALAKFGVNVHGASAYMAADQLAKSPKFREVKVDPKDLAKLPAGAVVVWNKGAGHEHGHISIALGNGKEASDKLRTQITNYGTSCRVFMPK